MPLTKLKAALPLGTAVTATGVTAYLIIKTTNDLEKNKQADEALVNLELTTNPFEEEIIKAEEEAEKEKTNKDEQDLEKKGPEKTESPEDKAKTKEESQDLVATLSKVEKDIQKIAQAQGESNQADIKIPEIAQPSSINQKFSSETGNIKKDESPSLPVNGKTQVEKEEDGLEKAQSLSEEEPRASVVSKENTKLDGDSKPSSDSFQEEEKQVFETSENLPEELGLSDDQPVMKSVGESSSGDLERHAEEIGDQHDEKENAQIRYQATSQKGEASSSNNGKDDKEGGSQMTKEQIEELMSLKDKMADFSSKLGTLLKGFR